MAPVSETKKGSKEVQVQSASRDSVGKSDQVKRPYKRKRSSKEDEEIRPENGESNIYEVENIVDHNEEFGRVISYFVKWKGWPDSTNTWEPLQNLLGCLETVVDYYERDLGIIEYDSHIHVFKDSLYRCSEDEMQKLASLYLRPNGDVIPFVDEEEHEKLLNIMGKLPKKARDVKIMKQLKINCQILEFKKRRTLQLNNLKQWEDEINKISSEKVFIKVVNFVDLEMRPLDFKYINKYKPGRGVITPEDAFLVGCQCNPTCSNKSKCTCMELSHGTAYIEGLLTAAKGTPVYECNKKCSCSLDCGNRILQRGRTVQMSIFKTNNGCGWGVRTLEKIQKGQFVTEYVGEVIRNEEAERRGKLYDREGRTYLFDLDFNNKKNCPYTVDAAEYGNVSHFINHSCNPNLDVYAVWVDCIDPDIPRLGLYASRNIKPSEELTFDYLCQLAPKNGKKSMKNIKEVDRTLCKCGSENCRTFLF